MRAAIEDRLTKEGGMKVVGMAETSTVLTQMYDDLSPDVVICDVSLGRDTSGIDATSKIVAKHPNARIVMFSADISEQTINAALKAGAAGYIDKRVKGTELYTCIRLAAEGQPVFDHTTSAAVISSLRMLGQDKASDRAATLSPREVEVVSLMAEGLTYDQIGERLFLSGKTIKTHSSRAMQKLGVSDRSAAVAKAMRLNIIT